MCIYVLFSCTPDAAPRSTQPDAQSFMLGGLSGPSSFLHSGLLHHTLLECVQTPYLAQNPP
jgi:hypothetical protein